MIPKALWYVSYDACHSLAKGRCIPGTVHKVRARSMWIVHSRQADTCVSGFALPFCKLLNVELNAFVEESAFQSLELSILFPYVLNVFRSAVCT